MHRHFARRFRLEESIGVPTGRFFGPGETRLALLSLLGEGPSHGYELMTKLEARCGGMYQASAGTIYPTLQQLEDQGMAQPSAVESKKVYALTAAGSDELTRHGSEVEEIWRRASTWSEWSGAGQPNAAEIFGPAMRLLKTALKVSAKSHGDPEVLQRVRAALERAHREIEQIHSRRTK